MVKRNTIFKKIVTYLTKELDMKQEDAKTHARQALVKNDRSDPANDSNDIGASLCDGHQPSCDSSSTFRTITGECNNLDNPSWGETNTPLLREILVESGNCNSLPPILK